jgi:hypothetical protein
MLGSFAGFVLIGSMFSQMVQRDRHPFLVQAGRYLEGLLQGFTGYKTRGGSPGHRPARHYFARPRCFREINEE